MKRIYVSFLFSVVLTVSHAHAQSPQVSIICCLHNAAHYIEGFLQTVTNQTIFKDCELIFVSGGGLTQEIGFIDAFKAEHSNIQHRDIGWDPGAPALINMAIDWAHAPYVLVAAVTDRYDAHMLERSLALLSAHADMDGIYSDYSIAAGGHGSNQTCTVCVSEYDELDMHKGMPGYMVLYRKELHPTYGYFRQDIKWLYRQELFRRATHRGARFKKMEGVPVVTLADELRALELGATEALERDKKTVCDEYCDYCPEVKNIPEKPIVVIIPSYKNAEWYARNLQAIFDQKYENYRVIYVDDMSPDGTGKLVEAYIKERGMDHKVMLIQNSNRLGAMANWYNAMHSCRPQEIVVMNDGDDWLAHKYVLAHLNYVYTKSDAWMTYGQFLFWPTGNPGWAGLVPQEWHERGSFRQEQWSTTHLRTCYAGLFQQVLKEDFMRNGKFLSMACDIAIMFPMTEMARKHAQFIPEILCIYNVATALSDNKVNADLQQSYNLYIRDKQPYPPVEDYRVGPEQLHIVKGRLFDKAADKDMLQRYIDQMKWHFYQFGYYAREVGLQQAIAQNRQCIFFGLDEEQVTSLPSEQKDRYMLVLCGAAESEWAREHSYHRRFAAIFTPHDAVVDNERYFRLDPAYVVTYAENVDRDYRRLCMMIADCDECDELLISTVRALQECAGDDFNFFGTGWNLNDYPCCYGLSGGSRTECMSKYQFCLFTQDDSSDEMRAALVSCLSVGCIPICMKPVTLVPADCYINAQNIASVQDIYERIKCMSYEQYQKYRARGKAFFESKDMIALRFKSILNTINLRKDKA